MRLFSYFILAYLAVAVQIGVSPFVGYHRAAPNLVLLAVIFIAVNAPRDAALLGCFGIGLLQDMVTQQQPGLCALSYGIVALFVTGMQQVVYKAHPLTHFSLALVGGLITSAVMLAHGWVRPASPRVQDVSTILPAIRISPTVELTRALYTAVLAPFVLALLQRARGLFGFQHSKRKSRSW
jgi:rod shape-determining protein MreD